MNEKISVIIPIYKVEKFLNQCISSIVNQTYSNLEIILVDDGSPDGCPKICDEWKKKDSRIKVIHKLNGGLSDARNAGLKIATGSIIAFVDSDDWLDEAFYEKLFKEMVINNCDIVSGGFSKVEKRLEKRTQQKMKDTIVLSNYEAMLELINGRLIQQVVWNKLYRKETIGDIQFEVGKFHEDEYWSYKVIGNATKIGIVDYEGYYYYQRIDSIMGKTFSENRLDAIEAKVQRQEYLTKKYPELISRGILDLQFECLYMGQCALEFLPMDVADRVVKKIVVYSAKYPVSSTVLRREKISHQVWLILAKISFKTTCKIRNWLHIGM